MAESYSAAYPDFIHYLRLRKNGGLSKARNAGVEYAMSMWPSLKFAMFPDPDDRVCRDYVESSYLSFVSSEKKVKDKGGKLGWVFEHPFRVGIAGYVLRLTEYSVLWNLVGATQMSSSPLSIEMYREGLRYREALQWGGEDWAFSVDALNAGYVGAYGGRLGFVWRQRPGSMSVSSAASLAFEHNRTYIRLSNANLFSYDSVVDTLSRENAHYAVCRTGDIRLASTPEELAQAFQGRGDAITYNGLARILKLNDVLPADPCPETYFFLGRALPGELVESSLFEYFVNASDYYAGLGKTVCHMFEFVPDCPQPVKLAAVEAHGGKQHFRQLLVSLRLDHESLPTRRVTKRK